MEFAGDFRLEGLKKAHFIGIGGIGMSGIARLLLRSGVKVSGSDAKASEITRTLSREGASVSIGHGAKALGRPEVVVISSAIKPGNPELDAAVKAGIPVIQRAQMLAQIASSKKTVTISGTHGKTTTTSMAAAALEGAGAGATVVVGGIFKNFASNVKFGQGEYFVIEADESDGSFLRYDQLVTCVTNIDSDHLDHYGDMAALKAAFTAHINKTPFYGMAALCLEDPGVRSVLPGVTAPFVTYGFGRGADWTARSVKLGPAGIAYDAFYKGRRAARIALKTGGLHNVLNSLGALACCRYLGFDPEALAKGLASFGGVKRRIEVMGRAGGALFLDDYGHHPTEIKATLAAVRSMYRPGRLVALFQPHRYSRTRLLHRDFAGAFGDADLVRVMDIYPAGEKPVPGVSSRLILDGLARAGAKAEAYAGAMELAKSLKPGDVVVTVGAGDVWKSGEEIRLKYGSISEGRGEW